MRAIPLTIGLLGALTGCMHTGTTYGSTGAGSAAATLRDRSGRELGIVTIAESGSGLLISGSLRGLSPGEHAIHLHERGSCTAPFDDAGGHWNPTGRQHGMDNPAGPHMGDMQNFTVGADSTANIRVTTPGGTLHGSNPLLDVDGAAVVVHQSRDDYRTNPAGNAGARIACGVVRGG